MGTRNKSHQHTHRTTYLHTLECVYYTVPKTKRIMNQRKNKNFLSLSVQKMKKPDVLFYYLTGKVCHFGRIVSTLPAGLKYLLTLSLSLAWVVPLLCVKWMAVCSVYKVKESRRKWWGVCVVTLTPYGDRLSIYTAVSFPGTLLFLLVVVAFSQLFMADHKNAHHRFFGERVSSAFKKDKFFDLVLVVARAPIKDGGRQKSQAN